MSTPPCPAPADARTLIEAAERHLFCALQPIVDARTGVPHAYEALMRGFAALGFADPPALLDAAAALGAVAPLERLLHRRALQAFVARRAEMPAATRLFVNIDSRAFSLDGPAIMRGAVAEAAAQGLVPARLCWEFSERHRLIIDEAASACMRDLHAAGARFAADDFGEGHSELRLLFDQRVDYIKIDKSFTHDLGGSGRRRLFIGKLANFAHVLGLEVVAEGVETPAALAACREMGCDMVQGWLVSRPIEPGGAMPAAYEAVAAEAPARRRREGERVLRALADRMLPLPALPADSALGAVAARLRAGGSFALRPVVEADGRPMGVLSEATLRRHTRPGRSAPAAPRARDVAVPCPVADIDGDLDAALERYAADEEAPCLLVTEDGRYAGVLMPGVLLADAVRRRIVDVGSLSPLSGLPGQAALREAVAEAAVSGGAGWRHVCQFDFDNFEPFNAANGFRAGDRAIGLFAAALRRHLHTTAGVAERCFLGHAGGDDFVAVLHGVGTEQARAAVTRLLADFAALAEGLHREEHQAAHCYEAQDRYGAKRRFPLLRASCAMLTLGPGTAVADAAWLDPVLARLTARAKEEAEGLACFAAEDAATLACFAERVAAVPA
jgi:EAL domain-containing protein (putative c-di-GMP-specific phosphodiesterase class I)/GGDEF domain-containing protein